MRKISSDDFEAAMYALDKIRKSSGKREGAWFYITYRQFSSEIHTYPGRAKEILEHLLLDGRIEIYASKKLSYRILVPTTMSEDDFLAYLKCRETGTAVKKNCTLAEILSDFSTTENEAANNKPGGWKPSRVMLQRRTSSGTTFDYGQSSGMSVQDSFKLAREKTEFLPVRERIGNRRRIFPL